MGKMKLTESQNRLLEITLERHTAEVMDLARMFARELGATNSQTTLQQLVEKREFDVPDPEEIKHEALDA